MKSLFDIGGDDAPADDTPAKCDPRWAHYFKPTCIPYPLPPLSALCLETVAVAPHPLPPLSALCLELGVVVGSAVSIERSELGDSSGGPPPLASIERPVLGAGGGGGVCGLH